MAETVERTEQGVLWISDAEAQAIFDAEARRVMGMSGEDFLRRYDAGEFDDRPDTSAEARVHSARGSAALIRA